VLDWLYCARKITAVEIGVGKLQPYNWRQFIFILSNDLGIESGAPVRSSKIDTRLQLPVDV